MMGFKNGGRPTLAQMSFLILVVVIPLTAGSLWSEHQRNSDIQAVSDVARLHAVLDDWQLYDSQIASCRRVNTIRERQNAVVSWIVQHDVTFPLRSEPVVVCVKVIKEPTNKRPPATANELNPGG